MRHSVASHPPSPRRSCFGNPSIILPKEGASVSRVRGRLRACEGRVQRTGIGWWDEDSMGGAVDVGVWVVDYVVYCGRG